MYAKPLTILSTLLLVTAGAGPVTAAGVSTVQQGDAYDGTYVSFSTTNDAVVDYTVNDRTVVGAISVQSKRIARNSGQVRAGVGLSAVTTLDGAAVSLGAKTATRATLTTESDAKLTTHDNGRGVIVLRAGGTGQYVTANLTSGATAKQAGERRVVVTKEDGTQGTFIVVGDGTVTVNEAGNVSADLGKHARLVYRQYDGDRSERNERRERLITEGVAAAEVYVQQTGGDGSETAADVVSYSEDTTVEVSKTSEGLVKMTAERAESEGRVILCTLSRQTFDAPDSIQVEVDGTAATRVSSYAAVRQAAQGGDAPAYLARSSTSGQAAASVAVGITEFSTRSVTMTSEGATATGDGSPTADGGGDGGGAKPTDAGAAGPGAVGALGALVVLGTLLAVRARW